MAFTQTERLISITTPLGRDVLLLEGFSGREAMSSLFSFTLYLLSESETISFAALVGKPATLSIKTGDGGEHYINGIISQFSQGHKESRFVHYHAVLVPWLWNLTLAADCWIFQEKTVPDIIQEVFRNRGCSDFKLKLSQNYPKRDYCVQYRETDFDFVSRLMEEEGIFYFFEQADGQHTLIMADSPGAHQPCPGQPSLPYNPQAGPLGTDSVSDWLEEQEIRPAKYALTDYNFETPSTNLGVNIPTLVSVGRNDQLEIYDYPGKYRKTGEGERYVKLRMEEQETPHTRSSGSSDCRSLVSGYLFNLTGHYRAAASGSYLLTAVNHEASSNLRIGGGEAFYSNTFTCIPGQVLYRPARITPRPVVMGPQTAVVVGRSGEEIDPDKYGRVKVQFHWDRLGKKNEKSSCWIRVAQVWAGKNWGGMYIPRIGQEVIVDFLEGDPDQPIITGRVYNADQMPPYDLPSNQTQSGIKSRSSKGGGTANFNEIRFEDKKGQEEVYVHAERNLTTVVEASESRSVGNSRTTTIQKDETLTIKQGNRNETLEKGNDTLKVNLGNITIEAPAGKYSLSAKDVEITGTTSVKIVCGASSIEMTPATITIKSPTIEINGSALTTVKGGLVKINC